jgi:cyclopropane-fatty-acyl-phospholipid synthase
MEVKTRRDHYAKTTAEWLQRLRSHEALIRQRWGDDKFDEYDRYLSACIMSFEKGYQSLVQIALRRVD